MAFRSFRLTHFQRIRKKNAAATSGWQDIEQSGQHGMAPMSM